MKCDDRFSWKKVSSFGFMQKLGKLVRIGGVIGDRTIEKFLCYVGFVFSAKGAD